MEDNSNRHVLFMAVLVVALSLFSLGGLFIYSVSGVSGLNKFKISNLIHKETNQPTSTIRRVSFVGVGDNLIHDTIYNPCDLIDGVYGDGKYEFDHLYEHIKPEINKYDLKYINQESIIAGDSYGRSGYPRFNTPETMINVLDRVGFNVINMANNHSMDMGSDGIISSVNLWDDYIDRKTKNSDSKDLKSNDESTSDNKSKTSQSSDSDDKNKNSHSNNASNTIYHAGIYKSEEDRNKPVIIEKNGIKIGFLAYTYGTNGLSPKYDYMISYLNEENLRKDVEKIKPLCDFILVSTHWGDEGIEALNSTQIKYSKLMNELGVDVVLGTHAHRIQKVEWLKNGNGNKTLVYYGTGNFVHNMLTPITYLEGMASFEFVKDKDKKYIDNARFTPLVMHLERTNHGYDGAVYKLSDYTVDMANRHIEMYGNSQGVLNMYNETIKRLVPEEFLN